MFESFKNHMQNTALRRTRIQLLQMTDRQLEDVGISRTLLQKGIANWPWRETNTANAKLTTQPARMKAREINKAINDLSRMSDKQLRDIGVSRGTIRHSVEHGINGHNGDDSKRVA